MMPERNDRRIPVALLSLRLGVFIVLLMWTLDKFVNPSHAAAVYKNFYFMGGLGNEVFYLIGAIQLGIILGFVIGFKKQWTYLLVLFLHAISTFSSFRQYFAPFDNLLFFAAWPMLAACFTLYYLRDLDTLWTIGQT
jgi:putative oxidoreductase